MAKKHFYLRSLSIQQRLPLLICFFLLSAITLYGFINYYSLKRATLTIGKERLNALTTQISTMLGQSVHAIAHSTRLTARQSVVIQYLKTNGAQFKPEALAELDKLHRDSTWVSIELLDTNYKPQLRSNKSTANIKIDIRNILQKAKASADLSQTGKIYKVNGFMYFPNVAIVTDNKQHLGYIVCWQLLKSTPRAVKQLSQLMGSDATLYIGNADGSLWTDMVKPLQLPFKIKNLGQPTKYINAESKKMLAGALAVPGTVWLSVVEFPEDSLLKGTQDFMYLIIIAGIVLTAIGIFAAWIMSRNITRPLNKLTIAAEAITKGDYSSTVDVDSNDELSKLANAFNSMAARISEAHHELEDKVIARTAQLENVNKELEAFSYSVSHDLRTPLRAINGYSIMLKEDYENKLDAEGNRIIGNIITNAQMMGQLIDELLAFSRLGKKELALADVDMNELTNSVTTELLHNEAENKYHININPLHKARADRGMIKQVLMNIVGNAIKYSSKKTKPEIEIGSKDEPEKTIYYVKDNGAGFDMAYAGKLFGVFQRLHSQEEFNGSGVGLALVKRIIDKHQGEVWAEGAENMGAVFYFSLPKN